MNFLDWLSDVFEILKSGIVEIFTIFIRQQMLYGLVMVVLGLVLLLIAYKVVEAASSLTKKDIKTLVLIAVWGLPVPGATVLVLLGMMRLANPAYYVFRQLARFLSGDLAP